VGGWYPGEGEECFAARLSQARPQDCFPAGPMRRPVTDAELREAREAREWRRAHGCMTMRDRSIEQIVEGLRNPPKLRHRRFGPSIPIR